MRLNRVFEAAAAPLAGASAAVFAGLSAGRRKRIFHPRGVTFEGGRAGTSDVTTFGSLVIDRAHEGDVVFNPFNSHPALKPAGGLNRLRRESYERSQKARPDTDAVA